MLKKVNTVILGLAALLAFGCGEDDSQGNPSPVAPEQKTCLLTKEIYKYGDTAEYSYNNAGQVESVYSTLNSFRKYRAYEIIYNADGGISEKRAYHPNSNLYDQKWFYTYNADKLPASITYSKLQNNVWKDINYTHYRYNAARQLIKKTYYLSNDTAASDYSLYSYPAPDHVVQNLYIRDNNGNYPLIYTYDQYYDDKQYYRTSLGYFKLSQSSFEEGLVSKHNLTTVVATDHLRGTTSTNSYGYTYNSYGYPVGHFDSTSGTIYFNYEYNCQ